jgi:hypothetical protein
MEETFVLILNALREGVAPICLHLPPPTRMSENPTKI